MPSTHVTDCVTILAAAWFDILDVYEQEHEGRKLIVTATFRPPDEQFRLYQQGRVEGPKGTWIPDENPTTAIVTQFDGLTHPSKHNVNPSRALDFAVLLPGGKVSWDMREYAVVGALAEARGLVWGGRWIRLRDGPHLEVPD